MVWGVHCCSLREIHHLIVLVLALYSQSPLVLVLVLFALPLLLLPDTTLLQMSTLPYSDEEMEAYTVNNIVTKLGFNTTHTEVLDEYAYSELPDI